MNNQIAILILFFNKVEQTIACINSFLPSGQSIYVLDNGSDAAQLKKLIKTFSGNSSVHITGTGKNMGVSGGRNFLINNTSEEWIFSVDNDITVSPAEEWVHNFQSFLKDNPQVKIICPHIYNVHEGEYAMQLELDIKNNKVSTQTGSFEVTNCFPGGASLIHRSVFSTYGLFDEEMFVGFEDYEYALRALLSEHGSLKARHIRNIELIHDHRFQKQNKDKAAVKQRYNHQKLKASYDRMVQKYNIVFDHDWQWWTEKQVATMTEKPWVTKIKGIFNRVVSK